MRLWFRLWLWLWLWPWLGCGCGCGCDCGCGCGCGPITYARPFISSSLVHWGVLDVSRNLVRHFICDLGKRCQNRLGLLSRLSHARSFGKLSMGGEDHSSLIESLPSDRAWGSRGRRPSRFWQRLPRSQMKWRTKFLERSRTPQ